MYELQLLRADHEAALLDFERANRAYFALSVSDRGDEFYENFSEGHRELLAEQEAGVCAFYVLLDAHADAHADADAHAHAEQIVVGRFNLYDLSPVTAEVGYRVAERVAGRGVATAALIELCRLAVENHRLQTLTAGTRGDNVASAKVLLKAGFSETGPGEVGGRAGTRYELALAPPRSVNTRRRPR